MLKTITNKKTSFLFSFILLLLAIFHLFLFGLDLGFDSRSTFFNNTFLFLILFFVFLTTCLFFEKKLKRTVFWQYGLISVILFLYEFVLGLGALSVMSGLFGFSISFFSLLGMIISLGFFLNNNLILFSKIQEFLKSEDDLGFLQIASKASRKIIFYQVITSFSYLIIFFIMFSLGFSTVKSLALGLVTGALSASYSTIFLSPLLFCLLIREEAV